MDISNLKLNFMQYRKVAGRISVALILLSLLSLSTLQLEWGLDFTGGTLVEVSYNDPVVPQVIRNQLSEAGYEGHVVQYFGSDRDILVRVPPQKALNSRENASYISNLDTQGIHLIITTRRSQQLLNEKGTLFQTIRFGSK